METNRVNNYGFDLGRVQGIVLGSIPRLGAGAKICADNLTFFVAAAADGGWSTGGIECFKTATSTAEHNAACLSVLTWCDRERNRIKGNIIWERVISEIENIINKQ